MKKTDIKLIVLDVDGVLTDGKLYIGSDGVEYKNFHVKDGMGISLARYCGLKVAIITGRKSKSVYIRSKELNVDFVFQGITNKFEVIKEIIASLNIDLENVFYMGDDINDLPVINVIGYSATPSDGVEIVRKSVDFVSHYKGGSGAVREAIEHILSLQMDFSAVVKNYLKEKIEILQ
jgi:3-deoxy-D-manno-octulosonate 8-phosphate phosphatase (KDO 8-P phosphatase)